MTDRIKLAEELEAAEGPSRELDARIEALFTDERGTRPLAFFRHQIENGQKRPCRFTSSIDAAMLLVPKGWSHGAGCDVDYGVGHDVDYVPGNDGWAWVSDQREEFRIVRAATPALALASAALKAGDG